jgi:RHS repeat-associated protein
VLSRFENPENRTIYSDGTTPPVTYSYDTAGRLATAANGTDTLTWSYDLAGQLLSEQSTKNSSTVAYTYDDAGNRLTVSLDGTLFVSYAYDDASRLTTITRGTNVFGFGYDNANRRTSMSYPNGVVTSYSYDTLNRLLNLQANKAQTPVTNFTYTYDAAGNRTSKALPDYTENYGYDALYRLTRAERTGSLTSLQTWSYDAVGNRLTNQEDNLATTSTYNAKNQLLSSAGGGTMLWRGTLDEPGTVSFSGATINGVGARMLAGNVFEANLPMQAGTNTVTLQATDTTGNVATKQYSVNVTGDGATYMYDPSGNVTQKVEGDDTWTYTWNALNQLTAVSRGGASQATYSYDPVGRRIETVAGTSTTAWVYDGPDIVRQNSTSGGATTTTRFIHGPSVDEALSQEAATTLYFHADALGSITRHTSATGSIAEAISYDAWGNIQGGTPTLFAFAGREWDASAQLYYYRARWYDARVGRFLSPDPAYTVRPKYGYAEQDPANVTDPTGMFERRNNIDRQVVEQESVPKNAVAQTSVTAIVICSCSPTGCGEWVLNVELRLYGTMKLPLKVTRRPRVDHTVVDTATAERHEWGWHLDPATEAVRKRAIPAESKPYRSSDECEEACGPFRKHGSDWFYDKLRATQRAEETSGR